MSQIGFYIDTSACIGCKTCELACKDKNNLPMGTRLRRVREYGGGGWTTKNGFMIPDKIFTYFVSASCMHCAKPACLEVCPVKAISKNNANGVVSINKAACIGCGSCLDKCPYDAPSLNKQEEKMYKCDLCQDLLSEGKNPVCVDGCLQRCLKTGELEKLHQQYGKLDTVPPLPAGKATVPSVAITQAVVPSGVKNARVRNTTEL